MESPVLPTGYLHHCRHTEDHAFNDYLEKISCPFLNMNILVSLAAAALNPEVLIAALKNSIFICDVTVLISHHTKLSLEIINLGVFQTNT